MSSKYGELFSSLGYDALDVILGINPQSISETEVKRLIHLISLTEENEALELDINQITNFFRDNPEMKLKLLLNLEQSCTINPRRRGDSDEN